jgi:hypothetical protein
VGDDGQQDPGTGRAFPAPHRKHDSLASLPRFAGLCVYSTQRSTLRSPRSSLIRCCTSSFTTSTEPTRYSSASCHLLLLLLDEKTPLQSPLLLGVGPRPTG